MTAKSEWYDQKMTEKAPLVRATPIMHLSRPPQAHPVSIPTSMEDINPGHTPQGSQAQPSNLHILTIPAFLHRISISQTLTGSSPPRAGHTCHL
ncbi:hypothetical protein VTK26DRAFT_3349 [Humicola hyalothermophila]